MALHRPSTRPRGARLWRQALQRAVLSPPSLALGAAAAVLATQPATWIPAGLLASVDLLVIFLQARNPNYIRQVADEMHREQWRETIARAEQLQRVVDPNTAAAMRNIIGAQERLLALSAGGEGLAPSRSQAADLMAHCVHLVEKRLRLESFLSESRPAELEREVARLRAQVDGTSDAIARQLFAKALEQKRAEIENLNSIHNAMSRIDGQLAAVDATFDNLVGKIIRLRTADVAAEGLDESYVLGELAQLSSGAAAVEASLTEMLTLRAPS